MVQPTKIIPFLFRSCALGVAMCAVGVAATLCVNPGGTNGCFSKIQDAVTHASENDTIQVAAGTYKEDVVIGKALSLIGANRSTTIIDATGLSNGIWIDGIDNPHLANVVVSGFTVENANFEGILITNASSITISDNVVTGNDKSLNVNNETCPGQPPFETSEDFDCGEGIHLMGVDHSVVAGNTVENNSGGILISDDTGATHHNLITRNTVRDNPYDCGITLPSHPPASLTHSKVPLGVFNNTIVGNTSSHNGAAIPGSGAGIGFFSPVPGGRVSGNVAVRNTVTNNSLPGFAFHAHAPDQNLDNNMIVSNYISGNAADTEDAFTPGPTGINVFGLSPIAGTVIALNTIENETDDIVVNTPAQVDIHLNSLLGMEIGVDNLGTGTANATENWWGCAAGPASGACSNVGGAGILFTPWLTQPFSPATPTESTPQ